MNGGLPSVSAIAVVLAGMSMAHADPCRPGLISSLPVLPNPSGRVLVPADLGSTRSILELDTGSDMNLLDPAAAGRLGLQQRRSPLPLIAGADGRALGNFVVAGSVHLGRSENRNIRFVVPPGWTVADPRATGMLGASFLRRWDIDLDLPHGRIGLYSPGHCLNMQMPFTVRPTSIPIQNPVGRLVIPVTLDGHRMTALLDTGATDTSLPLDLARHLFGIDPERFGLDRVSPTRTTDGASLPTYHARLHRLQIGDFTIDSPDVAVIATRPNPHVAADHDLVLGLSDIGRMRLYVAFQQNRLFIGSEDD